MLGKTAPASFDAINKLKGWGGFWYVATPYSKHPKGIYVAFEEAADITAWLLSFGLSVFSPIVHGHVLCMDGGLNPIDHDFWMKVDLPFMQSAYGLIVVKMDGFRESLGVQKEIVYFLEHDKPIIFIDPRDKTITFGVSDMLDPEGRLH